MMKPLTRLPALPKWLIFLLGIFLLSMTSEVEGGFKRINYQPLLVPNTGVIGVKHPDTPDGATAHPHHAFQNQGGDFSNSKLSPRSGSMLRQAALGTTGSASSPLPGGTDAAGADAGGTGAAGAGTGAAGAGAAGTGAAGTGAAGTGAAGTGAAGTGAAGAGAAETGGAAGSAAAGAGTTPIVPGGAATGAGAGPAVAVTVGPPTLTGGLTITGGDYYACGDATIEVETTEATVEIVAGSRMNLTGVAPAKGGLITTGNITITSVKQLVTPATVETEGTVGGNGSLNGKLEFKGNLTIKGDFAFIPKDTATNLTLTLKGNGGITGNLPFPACDIPQTSGGGATPGPGGGGATGQAPNPQGTFTGSLEITGGQFTSCGSATIDVPNGAEAKITFAPPSNNMTLMGDGTDGVLQSTGKITVTTEKNLTTPPATEPAGTVGGSGRLEGDFEIDGNINITGHVGFIPAAGTTTITLKGNGTVTGAAQFPDCVVPTGLFGTTGMGITPGPAPTGPALLPPTGQPGNHQYGPGFGDVCSDFIPCNEKHFLGCVKAHQSFENGTCQCKLDLVPSIQAGGEIVCSMPQGSVCADRQEYDDLTFPVTCTFGFDCMEVNGNKFCRPTDEYGSMIVSAGAIENLLQRYAYDSADPVGVKGSMSMLLLTVALLFNELPIA